MGKEQELRAKAAEAIRKALRAGSILDSEACRELGPHLVSALYAGGIQLADRRDEQAEVVAGQRFDGKVEVPSYTSDGTFTRAPKGVTELMSGRDGRPIEWRECCATADCMRPGTEYFESGGVGSRCCPECLDRIRAISPPSAVAGGVTVEMVEAAARVLVPVWYGGFEDQTQNNAGGWLCPPGTPNERAREAARAALTAAIGVGDEGMGEGWQDAIDALRQLENQQNWVTQAVGGTATVCWCGDPDVGPDTLAEIALRAINGGKL